MCKRNISDFWFLELIAENLSEKYVDFWIEELFKTESWNHGFIMTTLSKMGRRARKELWHIRQTYKFSTDEETEKFRNLLDDIMDWETRPQH